MPAEDPLNTLSYFPPVGELHQRWQALLKSKLEQLTDSEREDILQDVFPQIEDQDSVVESILQGDPGVFRRVPYLFSRLASVFSIPVEKHMPLSRLPEGLDLERWKEYMEKNRIIIAAGTGGSPENIPEIDDIKIYMTIRFKAIQKV